MSYKIDFTDIPNNPTGITVEDQSLNAEKSIDFVGKNYTGYAKIIAESFLHLLENFARSSSPGTQPNEGQPVKGQLWYDTTASQPQLKVYDGITWQPAGNVKRRSSQPQQSESVVGDLWVDTANQQLYLWSGSSWILIGPQFSEGTVTGPKVESIVDTLLIENFVISFYVSDTRIAIISATEFIPKQTIDGFSKVRKGFNLRDTIDSTGVTTAESAYRLVGTATNSEKLGGVASTSFLRNDINTTTNGTLSVRNNGGLIIGSDLSASLTNTSSGATVLYNKTEGSSIFLRTNQDGNVKDVITVTGTNVGINKTNPVYELDVIGTVRTSENLFVSGTNNAVDLNTGSMRTAGGLSVQKSLQVGEGITVTGTINSNSIIPTVNSAFDLGTENYPFRNINALSVKATTFTGALVGEVVGSVNGSASRLASATKFKLQGEVTSNEINFNGLQTNGEAVFTTQISQDFISTKGLVNFSNDDDLLLVQRPSSGLQKITVAGFLSRAGVIPVGTILPFAGQVIPNGFLLCDGSEYTISQYVELWQTIGYVYKPLGLLQGVNTFAVPDLRGRFPLGLDNMFGANQVVDKNDPTSLIYTVGTQANRVNDAAANQLGASSGSEDTIIDVNQLPEHIHDMKALTSTGTKGQQYYAIRNSSDPGGDFNTVSHTTKGPTALNESQFLPNSGGVDNPILGSPVNLMTPYISLNYIIFSGRFT